jgi:hypothetical protein
LVFGTQEPVHVDNHKVFFLPQVPQVLCLVGHNNILLGCNIGIRPDKGYAEEFGVVIGIVVCGWSFPNQDQARDKPRHHRE